MTPNWRDRLIANDIDIGAITLIVTAVLILGMTASFGASHTYALRTGGLHPNHAWMAPVFTDALFLIACATSLITAIRTPHMARLDVLYWGPITIRLASGAGSFYLNLAAAPTTPGAHVVAALPPTAIVVCTEMLMVIARRFLGLEQKPINQPNLGPASAEGREKKAGGSDTTLEQPGQSGLSLKLVGGERRAKPKAGGGRLSEDDVAKAAKLRREGRSWPEIAGLLGGRVSADGVRMRVKASAERAAG